MYMLGNAFAGAAVALGFAFYFTELFPFAGPESSPLAEALKVSENPFAVSVISLGGLLATASVLLTSILGVSREAYAMALRDALPSSLSRLHPVHGTPYLSIWISGLLMALMVLSIDLEKVVALSTFGLLFYIFLPIYRTQS